MAKPKRVYRREELIEDWNNDCGHFQVCNLCDGVSPLEDDKLLIDHEDDCPLADPNVLAIQVVTMTRPREYICDTCPEEKCFCDDRRSHTHEDLLLMCARYAYANARSERK